MPETPRPRRSGPKLALLRRRRSIRLRQTFHPCLSASIPSNPVMPTLDAASPTLQQAVAQAPAVNPVVLARHLEADSLPVPMRLTAGQATQDPNLISVEQNKRNGPLATHFNQQGSQLAQNVDAIRNQVAPGIGDSDPVSLGQAQVDAYKSMDAKVRSDIADKYQALRDANGGAFPVDGPTFVQNATDALSDEMKDAFVPTAISSTLDKFADGSTPMTFKDFENLRTNLAAESRKAARSGDGNTEAALAIIRNQLEALPMMDETADIKPIADAARDAARDRFTAISTDPAYKAVVNDDAGLGEPSPLADKFMRNYVVNAPTANLWHMIANLSDNPTAQPNMAAALMDHLKSQAGIDLRTNTGNFSQAGYNRALSNVNPKLDLLFDPQSAQQARSLGNVAQYTQSQPRGSYVNNSNTFVAGAAAGAANAAEGAANAAFPWDSGRVIATTACTVARSCQRSKASDRAGGRADLSIRRFVSGRQRSRRRCQTTPAPLQQGGLTRGLSPLDLSWLPPVSRSNVWSRKPGRPASAVERWRSKPACRRTCSASSNWLKMKRPHGQRENEMLKTACAALLIFFSAAAFAQVTCQQIGFRYAATAQEPGSTSQRIGNQTITNFNNGTSATSQAIGNQNLTNYSNGQSATSQQIGTSALRTTVMARPLRLSR